MHNDNSKTRHANVAARITNALKNHEYMVNVSARYDVDWAQIEAEVGDSLPRDPMPLRDVVHSAWRLVVEGPDPQHLDAALDDVMAAFPHEVKNRKLLIEAGYFAPSA